MVNIKMMTELFHTVKTEKPVVADYMAEPDGLKKLFFDEPAPAEMTEGELSALIHSLTDDKVITVQFGKD